MLWLAETFRARAESYYGSKKIKKTKKITSKKVIASKQERAIDYQELLFKRLKDHDFAVEYLNTAIEESLKGDEESQQLFLRALKNVAQAYGSMSTLAKRAKLRRESL